MEELSLSANQLKKDMLARRVNFATLDRPGGVGLGYSSLHSDPPSGKGLVVKLVPLQIRTFLIQY